MYRPTCKTCLYWEGDDAPICRRNPPRVSDDGPQFPTAYSHDWCGEHSAFLERATDHNDVYHRGGERMSEKHDDGGPAFPRTGNFSPEQEAQFDCISQDGMTLWDFYAAAALQGCIARQSTKEAMEDATQTCDEQGCGLTELDATTAAMFADAMIAERRKRGIGS